MQPLIFLGTYYQESFTISQNPCLSAICTVLIYLSSIIWFLYCLDWRFIEVEYAQMIAILSLIDTKFTKDLKDFYSSIKYFLFGFPGLVSNDWTSFLGGVNQENKMLLLLGFKTTSAIESTVVYFVAGLLVLVISAIIILLTKCILKWRKCVIDVKESYLHLLFNIAVRYLLLGWLLVCISSINEVMQNYK